MPLKTHLDEQPSLNLTPMIDIVFLLIIFFMVGTKFVEMEPNIPLKLPQVSDAGALTPAPRKRVVSVYRDGRIALDRDEVTLDELTVRLAEAKQQYSDLALIVRGDGGGSFENVARVLGACRRAGVNDLGISVRLANEPGAAKTR